MSGAAPFQQRVRVAMADRRVIASIRLATLHKVDARASAMAELRDPDGLRHAAGQIKQHTLDRLPDYLEQFVAGVEDNGGCVHLASDADDARRIICGIARAEQCGLAVKSKSMTTEEIHLNAALEATGVRTIETDLGEFIVQLDGDTPSHIVTPIIHKDRRQVAETMAREIGCSYTEDPAALTMIARAHLREMFRRCDLGITGVNFGVAQSGTLCICTNEGNARMTITRPRVHIAVMGIEKLIPRMSDLPVFLKLLARSSTGQALTVYTTLVTGPRRSNESDGPASLHVVLLDNGRSGILAGPCREVLRCIRCGACLNACPVYRSVGGHAYGSVYPGPIGSLVTPLLEGLDGHDDLPRASSLCGACEAACPVKIDIPKYLVMLREQARGLQPLTKRAGMWAWSHVMRSPALYRAAQWSLRRLLPRDANGWASSGFGPMVGWMAARDLPPPAKQSFRELWRNGLGGSHVPHEHPAAARANDAPVRQSPPERRTLAPNAMARMSLASADVRQFLTQLRSALGTGPTAPLPGDPSEIARQVQPDAPLVARFSDAAQRSGCLVHETACDKLGDLVATILARDSVRTVVTYGGEWLGSGEWAAIRPFLEARGIAWHADPQEATLFSAGAGITAVAAAVAETGSIVCESGVGLWRSASLVPPIHLAVVRHAQIVPDLCDLFLTLGGRQHLPSNVNVITGPSKTADIEGVLVTGVHGPGTVHIILTE